MKWSIEFHDEFYLEFLNLELETREEILVKAKLIKEFGPQLGRPYVDTLIGSIYPNMKELRFKAGNDIWRVAFAFDPLRSAILLTAGNKQGKDQKLFYKKLIRTADQRFADHLEKLN